MAERPLTMALAGGALLRRRRGGVPDRRTDPAHIDPPSRRTARSPRWWLLGVTAFRHGSDLSELFRRSSLLAIGPSKRPLRPGL